MIPDEPAPMNRSDAQPIESRPTAWAEPGPGDGASGSTGDVGAVAAASKAIVEIRGMSVAYGSTMTLHDIGYGFQERTVTAIMGPSGCGKTTVVKSINRTLELIPGARLMAGEVLFHGADLYAAEQDPRAVRKRIGIIHQKPTPFPMSVVDNVLFGAVFHGHATRANRVEYAEHYLDLVGLLDEVRDRFGEAATNLSGGQQQRLCLARTLANQPEVILMDEPCSSLDHAATLRIEALIRDLAKTYAIIIVTHNMSQARRVSDRSCFLFEGRIVEQGATEDMFREPKNDLTRAFVSGLIG